jgi:excisionase family DNA binding protein
MNAVYTLQEAAQHLKVSTKTLVRLIKRGELPAFKVGRAWRLREEELIAWAKQQGKVGKS